MLEGPLFCFGCTIMMTFFYIHSMQALISVDSLTRLNNRGQINRYMEQLRYRENMQLYVMMIDIDRFKEINDTCGHAEGDRALTVIGRCLNEVSTRNIIPYRVGGDEFTILFADQGEETVRKTLERLKESVAAAGYHVAVGYTMNRGVESLDELLRDSDQNMYKDKADFYQQKGHDRRTRN
jgi:diguanylate cyclase (GGDEF)-like protein